MLPQTYTVDSQSKAQDLSSLILSASSPSQISSAVTSVHTFLHHLSPDQSRWFFSLAFPTLIAKLFGFDDSSSAAPPSFSSSSPAKALSVNGWIDTVCSSNDSDLAGKVFSLLAPNSVLLSLISAVDRLCLVKFVFPIERLPEWIRFMLSNERDSRVLADLCPLFRNRLKEDPMKISSFQIQLNVFEYYMFWFAYYPVCRGSNGISEGVSVQKSKVFRLESWASPFKGFSSAKPGSKQKIEYNLYIRLFYAYLRAFVPMYDLNAHQPYRSSLLHYQSGSDGSVLIKAEFFINLLINFWLVDNDFSPVPVSVCKSFGVSFPFRSVLGEIPPTLGLGEVIKVMVKYLNLSQAEVTFGSNQAEYSESPRWKASGSGSFDVMKSREVLSSLPCLQFVGSWNSLIHRPLYRFLLRTFLFCPVETSIKNVSEVFSVWISFLEPWKISSEDFAELDAVVDRTEEDGKKMVTKSAALDYSSSWQGYVLSNYLFYSSLVMHFIGFAHKFLHADAKIIVEMVVKVVNILVSSRELTELLKNVDTIFHSKQAGTGKPTLHNLYSYVPSIREQLQDWENGLCESDADGSFLHDDWNKDLRLFNDGEDGGRQLLQLFILRAESELQATSNNSLNSLQSVDTLKSQVKYLFGGHTKPISFMKEASPLPLSRDEMFTPRRLGNNTFADVKYKGDWMMRPISDDEVAWLAKLLIHLSAWLNEKLGLNQSTSDHTNPAWTYIEVSGEASNVHGSFETAKTVFRSIFSWLLMLGLGIVGQMRKRGVKVNLRVLASKKVVMILLLSVIFYLVKKAFVGLFGRV